MLCDVPATWAPDAGIGSDAGGGVGVAVGSGVEVGTGAQSDWIVAVPSWTGAPVGIGPPSDVTGPPKKYVRDCFNAGSILNVG